MIKWIVGIIGATIAAVAATYVSIILGLLPAPTPTPTPMATPTEIAVATIEPAPIATAAHTAEPTSITMVTDTPGALPVRTAQTPSLLPQLCGKDAFAEGTFDTSSPRFVRPEGYGPGWITSDPLDLVMPEGNIEPIRIRHVLIVQNLSTLQLQNVHVGNIWGCWLREDRADSILNEAAYEYRRMKNDAPTEETGVFQLTSGRLERVNVDESGLPVKVVETAAIRQPCNLSAPYGLGYDEISPSVFIPTTAGAIKTFSHCPPGETIQYRAIAVDDTLLKVELVCNAGTNDITNLFESFPTNEKLLHYHSSTVVLRPDCRVDFTVQDIQEDKIGLMIKREVPQQPTPTSTTLSIPPSPTGLTPDEARSWCQGDHCAPGRFSQIQESNGVINPYGVLMATGDPVAFDLPAGISVDLWDCFQASQAVGPISLPQVCQASFRRDR